MANSTARIAKNIHGTNPQFLIERVIRGRIYDSTYWKEHCFALTAESLVDKALSLTYIGGTYGIQRPTEFLCLLCKLLQIQPNEEIILEYLRYEEFKYLRALAAMYIRLTFPSLQVYEVLEPLLNDYRKLRFRNMSGNYHITYMDEFTYELLTKERVCELILPRLTRRDVLEEVEGLAPRTSKLEDALLADGEGEADSDAMTSDDSAALLKKEKRMRIQRARRVRQEKEAHNLNRLKMATDRALEERMEENVDEIEYPSQEEESNDEKPYISRNPSPISNRSGSSSRSRSRSASPMDQGYQSRSPSRSPDRQGYISRSVSQSSDCS